MAVFDKYTPMSAFSIRQPRYRDRTVMLATYRVGTHNKIIFTEAPSMGDTPYYVSGANVKKCKKESNGKIECYVVPLGTLEPLEISSKSVHELY